MYPLAAQFDFLSNAGPSHYNVPSLLSKSCESTHRQAPAYTQVGRSVKGGFHEDFGKVTSITGTVLYVYGANVYLFRFPWNINESELLVSKLIMRAGVNSCI